MHPLLKLVATRPELLADHADAYVALVADEVGSASSAWTRRAVLGALALCLFGVAAVLGGVALMLWAVVPAANVQVPWLLVATPALPLVLALLLFLTARAPQTGGGLDKVVAQVKADMAMLRAASAA